jgi:hypothetical protein
MKLDNRTPFSVFTMPGEGPDSHRVLTVIVKGTFTFEPDSTASVAPEQEPVLFADVFSDPESASSLRFEDDLAPFKPRTDVVVVGNAMAPGGQPVTSLDVGFAIGPLDKTVRVVGNRCWLKVLGNVSPGEPQPFTELELAYENAFGGLDLERGGVCPENPVGRGMFGKKTKSRDIDGKRLPNLEDPRQPVRTWKDRPTPMGFGFIAKGWQSRLSLLGTFDEAWQEERSPAMPLDFSFDYYNAAPRDQQVEGYLKGDERVILMHLTPRERATFSLPGVRPDVAVTRSGTVLSETVAMNLDTLCLMPSESRLYQVWRGTVRIPDLVETGIGGVFISL